MKRVLSVALWAFAAAACGAPAAPPWQLEPPAGVERHELRGVLVEQRDERVEMIEDLVIAARGGDAYYAFSPLIETAVGTDGRIFVLDKAEQRIQVFDAAGRYIGAIERRGSGAGELSQASALAMVGDELFVADLEDGLYHVFSPAGEYLRDVRPAALESMSEVVGFTDGMLAGKKKLRRGAQRQSRGSWIEDFAVTRLHDDGAAAGTVHTFPSTVTPVVAMAGAPRGARTAPVAHAKALFAAHPAGAMYAAFGASYQVYAYGAGGEMRWALRVAWQPGAVTDDDIDAAVAEIRSARGFENVDRTQIAFPQRRPALSGIEVDGDGFLYVFIAPSTRAPEDADRLVDVYSQAGERVFAGSIAHGGWDFAAGEHVYVNDLDPDTGAGRVVRYRLRRPWQRAGRASTDG